MMVGYYVQLLAKYLKLRVKVQRLENTCTEIIEENRQLHDIVADLKNGSVY